MRRILKGLGLALLALLVAGFALGYTPDTDPVAMKARYASAASRFIDVGGGLSVHIRDEGKRDAPVLVLLHGSNASLHTWEPWVARLGAKYRIISLDQIGHGLTGPNPAGRYDGDAFVATLDAALVKLGVSHFALAGNSMGGYVAWEYALAHPGKVAQLVLIDAGGPPDDPKKDLPLGFRIARTPGINRLAEVIAPRSVFEKSLHQTVSNQRVVTPAVVDRYWELNRRVGTRAASLKRFQTPHDDFIEQNVAKIATPTLILWGELDTLVPRDVGDAYNTAIKGSRLIVYKNVGHIPMEEVPEPSARAVREFLAPTPPSN